MNNKLVILTWHNIRAAYSCLHYLKKAFQDYTYTELWSLTPDSANIQFGNEGYYTFYNQCYWKIPGLRRYFAKIHVFLKMIRNPKDIYIINDFEFIIPAYYAKKINKKIRIVHYNTEIAGEDVKVPAIIQRFYKSHASFPDMIIECLDRRAEWRKKQFNISKKIYVINNTLPRMDHIENADETMAFIKEKASGRKILLYAGRAGMSRNLKEILDCIPDFINEVFFVFFCYGTEKEISDLLEWATENRNYNNYSINEAINRDKLLRIMQECDIGINYYDPKISINHKFAAPSKFFEYIACGMNVVSTNNIGINKIIENNHIGVCIRDGETIHDALRRMLNMELASKEEIRNLFNTKYEYGIDSKEALDKIREMI